MDHATLHELAADPALVKGIYLTCDQWCAYCPATDRCLAFRCSPESRLDVDELPGTGDGEHVMEGLAALKSLTEAEGCLAPPEIEAMLSDDRECKRRLLTLNDSLERLGRVYMSVSEAYVNTHPHPPVQIAARPSGPTPFEVFAWYHAMVPARVFRAILCLAEHSAGVHGRRTDMLGAAKMALVGLDRSIDAVQTMSAHDDDPRLELMQSQLRRLRTGVEQRFPGARGFIRPGLDDVAGHGDRRGGVRRAWRHSFQRLTSLLFRNSAMSP